MTAFAAGTLVPHAKGHWEVYHDDEEILDCLDGDTSYHWTLIRIPGNGDVLGYYHHHHEQGYNVRFAFTGTLAAAGTLHMNRMCYKYGNGTSYKELQSLQEVRDDWGDDYTITKRCPRMFAFMEQTLGHPIVVADDTCQGRFPDDFWAYMDSQEWPPKEQDMALCMCEFQELVKHILDHYNVRRV